jgi:hypothetical protein
VHQGIRVAAESVRVLCGKALDTGRTVSVVDIRSAGEKNKFQRAAGSPEVPEWPRRRVGLNFVANGSLTTQLREGKLRKLVPHRAEQT